MAREPRPPRPKLDRPGERPLLQGHLRRGGQRALDAKPQPTADPKPTADPQSNAATESAETSADAPPETPEAPPAAPATEVAIGDADAVRGKATRSPAEVATRKHLEGSEQGPR